MYGQSQMPSQGVTDRDKEKQTNNLRITNSAESQVQTTKPSSKLLEKYLRRIHFLKSAPFSFPSSIFGRRKETWRYVMNYTFSFFEERKKEGIEKGKSGIARERYE